MAITFSTINGHTVPFCTKSQFVFKPLVMAKKLRNDNIIGMANFFFIDPTLTFRSKNLTMVFIQGY